LSQGDQISNTHGVDRDHIADTRCFAVELDSADQLYDRRVARILTSELPRYFAVVSRVRQDSHYIGADGLVISSSVSPEVKVVFPPGALTKSIPVGLQVYSAALQF